MSVEYGPDHRRPYTTLAANATNDSATHAMIVRRRAGCGSNAIAAIAIATRNGTYWKPLMRVKNRHAIAPADSTIHRRDPSAPFERHASTRRTNAISENASVGTSVTGKREKNACSGLTASSRPATRPALALPVSRCARRWKYNSEATDSSVSA